MRFIYLSFFLSLLGCSTIQKWGLRSTSPVFRESNARMARERNWEFLKESAPGNLKFLELLSLQDKNNTILLGTLAKAYAGYAFAIYETLYFEDSILGVNDSQAFKQAIDLHTRALDNGLNFLDKKGISRKELLELDEGDLLTKLGRKLDDEDLEGALYTAQAWASLINLQKDNMNLISQVPRVKIIFDFVCKEEPKIDNGVCDMFYAQYEASRPKMLGGNPQRGRELYADAMVKYPKNLLIRMNYIQYSLLPSFEAEQYEVQAEILRKEFAIWENLNRDNLVDESPYRIHEDLNLYNAVAKKRFEIIEKHKAKIF